MPPPHTMPSPAHVHAAYNTASESSVLFRKNSTLPSVMAVTENHSSAFADRRPIKPRRANATSKTVNAIRTKLMTTLTSPASDST